MLKRQIYDDLLKEVVSPEIAILTGPRRVGKTTLLNSIEQYCKPQFPTLYADFTDPSVLSLWEDFSQEKIARIINEIGSGGSSKKIIFFDEIQYLTNSGKLLKLFYDHFPNTKIFATGSSSFLLLQSIGESLAGRKKLITLYPLSLSEMAGMQAADFWGFKKHLLLEEKLSQSLEYTLIFGSYPGIFTIDSKARKIETLKEIADSLLFKDLLTFEHVKKPRVLVELTKLLAYQIGNLINSNEIAQNLGISRKTVLDYIDLLERFYVIKKLYPYEQNMRDVIRKQFKVYFFDLGIRNAIIGDYREIKQRSDKGALLENAVVMGILRRISYDHKLAEPFFWRDYEQKEVDLLLKEPDHFTAIEVKHEKARERIPRSFSNHFPEASSIITGFKDAYRFCL